eukprot:7248251-Alexandrium_andersonii.AAC.1
MSISTARSGRLLERRRLLEGAPEGRGDADHVFGLHRQTHLLTHYVQALALHARHEPAFAEVRGG